MKVDTKELEGKWFAPKRHPVTCGNPAPWQIEFVKIEEAGRVLLRCEGSMWFSLENCICDTKVAFEEWLEDKGRS